MPRGLDYESGWGCLLGEVLSTLSSGHSTDLTVVERQGNRKEWGEGHGVGARASAPGQAQPLPLAMPHHSPPHVTRMQIQPLLHEALMQGPLGATRTPEAPAHTAWSRPPCPQHPAGPQGMSGERMKAPGPRSQVESGFASPLLVGATSEGTNQMAGGPPGVWAGRNSEQGQVHGPFSRGCSFCWQPRWNRGHRSLCHGALSRLPVAGAWGVSRWRQRSGGHVCPEWGWLGCGLTDLCPALQAQ